MADKKTLLVIDGYALIFRAYYALIRSASFTTTDGRPTSAIFGFIKMVINVLNSQKPDYVVLAWDTGEKTFRDELYPEYKANRKETPDELKSQIPEIIKAVEKFGLSSLTKENYEADDVIGTLCEKMRKNKDLDVYILSGDKDLLQLVGDNVKAIANKKGVSDFKIYDKEAVKEKWGVYPERIVDLFSFLGDSSDNIPGVKGIGQKGAVKLLSQFDTMEEVFDNKDKIKTKRAKTILEKEGTEDSAKLSKELLQIKTDIDIDINLEEFTTYDFSSDSAIEVYDNFELRSIKNSQLPKKTNKGFELIDLKQKVKSSEKKENKSTTKGDANRNKKDDLQQDLFSFNDLPDDLFKGESAVKKGKYRAVTRKSELEKLLDESKKTEFLSFDFETTSEEPIKAEPIGFSLAFKEGEAVYIPFPSKHKVGTDFKDKDLIDFLKEIFSSDTIKIIGQNLKYEYIILRGLDINPINFYFDTMLGAYVLDPDNSPFNMDVLAKRMLGYETTKYKDLVSNKNETLLDVEFKKVVDYAGEDADITLRLFDILHPQINESKMKSLYYDMEMPLIEVLGDMEIDGVYIDTEYFAKMSKEIESEMDKLEKKIYELNNGEEFNINSPKQLQEVLFDKLGLKSTKKTGKGSRSTDVTVLEQLSSEHEIPKLILDYRTIAKLKNTYLDALPKLIYDKTGRIHASFNQAITSTGRLSSSNPNLQNIPIRGDLGRKIRRGFIPENNNLILSADYSQIELRLLAHFSDEPKLIDAYNQDKDLHLQTASLLFNKSESDITKDERTQGKTINFSIIYGIGARKLGKDLGIGTKKANSLISSYFEQYPKVKEFIETQKREGRKNIAVYTLFNRVRYLRQFLSRRGDKVSHAERLSVNSPIQGTSADLIKVAMIKIKEEFDKEQLKSKLIIQVHDELVFEVVKNEVDKVKEIVKNIMENVRSLKIPLKVNIEIGNSWDEAH